MTAGDILKLKLIQEAAEKVGRCSLTPGCPRVDLAWCQCIQRARLKHDDRLSNFAFYINLAATPWWSRRSYRPATCGAPAATAWSPTCPSTSRATAPREPPSAPVHGA